MSSRHTLCLLEASKLGLILDYEPSGERNRCLLPVFREDVIDALENFMFQSRLFSVQNEVSMCFILYRIRPLGGGAIPYKSHMGRRPLGRGFGPLARFFHKQDLKLGINSGKNLPYNHINRYFFQHIFRHNQGHELGGTLHPNLGWVPPAPSPGFKKYSGLLVHFLFFQSFILWSHTDDKVSKSEYQVPWRPK